jgi:predicted transcriptional regulator
MGEISRAMSERDRTEDVKNYLQGLYESGNLGEEKYEELADSEEFLQKAVELFDKMEDCNTPFNTTMELAVDEARKEMAI